MNLLWPGFLLTLGLIPLIVGVYIWIMRRRKRYALRYSSLSLVRQALPAGSRWRRHLPFGLFLLALVSLVMALTRPIASIDIPTGQTTIILAMDISHSMCSADIPPNRLRAAESAALSFIRSQVSKTQIGIVVFAGFAEIILAPTNDLAALEDAIGDLTTARRTAIGSGILSSLQALAEVDGSVAPLSTDSSSAEGIEPLPDGTYLPHIIVLLTDGASNTGPFPLDAAQMAAERGVRVYTIGFGTDQGGTYRDCGEIFWGGGYYWGGGGSFGGFGRGFRRGIDEVTLMQIADITGGEYYLAESANELEDVFRGLPLSIITRRETMEVSALFVALGGLLAAAAVVLSQLWHPLT